MKQRILNTLFAALMVLSAQAQSGTNSPYSQYGLGILSDRSQGFSRGMNGVGLALRKGNIVNTLNPASYSAIDSLTMIFDAGLSGQVTSFKEGGKSINANNADFEYAAGCFRLLRNVGVGFGVLPYSNVGYTYTSNTYVDRETGTIPETYTGSGGLHQVFVGMGWNVLKPLSIGVNASYLWGSYKRSVGSTGTSSVNSLSKVYSASVSSYNIEMGLQWQQPLNRQDMLTIGVTYGLGHKLGADAECSVYNSDVTTSVVDTTTTVIGNALSLPTSFGVGLGWTHADKLFVGADLSLQKWGSEPFPSFSKGGTNGAGTYTLNDGQLKDRYRVALGGDYVPSSQSRHLLNRVHYRFGAGYATPYIRVNGQDGPKELSLSAGLGIPLQNSYNNRSLLNISFQWAHASADRLITENTFRINLGLTFNERWFAKWRID